MSSVIGYVGNVPSGLDTAQLIQFQAQQINLDIAFTNYAAIANALTIFSGPDATAANTFIPLYTAPPPPPSAPSEKLIPGIICDGIQDLGDGQPMALRLYDSSNHTLHDLNVKELRYDVTMQIDSSKNIYISCVSDSSYQGQHILTMIFNIFDASGWALEAENDVSLNITNSLGLNNLTSYDISLAGISIPLTLIQNPNSESIISISNELVGTDLSYSIYIDNNNELYIKSNDSANSYNNYYVNSFNFNLVDNSSNLLGPSDVYLHLAPATGYDISYNTITDSSFSINKNSIPSMSSNYLIKLDTSGSLIGKLYPYAYRIQPGNLEYYNINNLTYKENNLITLTTTPVLLGKLNF